MPDVIRFDKLSGSGNDFVCIDNMDGRFGPMIADAARVGQFARTLCRRGLGVGADGVIFAEGPEIAEMADISARFFEADGSEAELCGNGTACFVRWVTARGICKNGGREIRILTPAGVVLGRNVSDGYARVCIPLPEHVQSDLSFDAGGRTWRADYAVTGVPHAVIFVDDLENLDIWKWGPAIRYHERFQPRGVNANFVQVLGEGALAIRTWEFGVEGETLACGTGSAAAAILATKRFGWSNRIRRGEQAVELKVLSGDILRVYLTLEADGSVSDLCLESLVRSVFSGELSEELVRLATT